MRKETGEKSELDTKLKRKKSLYKGKTVNISRPADLKLVVTGVSSNSRSDFQKPTPLQLHRRRKMLNVQDSRWTITAPSALEDLSQFDFIH